MERSKKNARQRQNDFKVSYGGGGGNLAFFQLSFITKYFCVTTLKITFLKSSTCPYTSLLSPLYHVELPVKHTFQAVVCSRYIAA